MEMLNKVEQLVMQFSSIPKIEETGPQKGFNGKHMARLALRSRLIYATICIIGLFPLVLFLLGINISPTLIAVGLGLIVPGGSFMATGHPIFMAAGLFFTFYLWRKVGMKLQDKYGSPIGLIGFWLLGLLGGLPTSKVYWWSCILPFIAAGVLWVPYELRVKKMYREMWAAREERIAFFDEALSDLDKATAVSQPAPDRELDEEQLKLARYLWDACVRENGDFSAFDHFKNPVLTDNRYQFTTVGYALMILKAKYLKNFNGYLAHAHRFCIDAVTDYRTCGYWLKQSILGYFKYNPNPISHANIMLSGWMMPIITGYGDLYGDRRYEEPGSIKFKPFKNRPEKSYDYDAKSCVEVLYNQYHPKRYPYMLIPCEPHVAFPICNVYGIMGMLIYDRDHNTDYCEKFFPELYENLSQNFVEVEGSIALRRQDTYGLRFMPDSQIGYDPMADVQNYLFYASVFPGLARRNYALLRKSALEIVDGVTYIKGQKWEDIFDMSTMSKNPSLSISHLEMVASAYGDTEIVEGLKKAESMFLNRSKNPKVFKFQNVPVVTMANFAFARFAQKNDWNDIILRGIDPTALTGPVLEACSYPDVLVAKACSSGDDLELVLYNGEEAGEQKLSLSQLQPGKRYMLEGCDYSFLAEQDGTADIFVYINGRTPVHIIPQDRFHGVL